MKQLQGTYPLTMLCRVLAIRRSAYYAWRKRPVHGPSIDLQQQACEFHRRSRGAAGTRPLAQALGISRWRARRLMQTCQLVSKQPSRPKFRRAPVESTVVPNQLNRAFQPTAPNRVWCGDITYISMAGRWAYLAVVLDLYARRVVGWSLSMTPDAALVTQAMRRAVETRCPKPGLLFHSDQGVQYRSEGYRDSLARVPITQSMSRKGNCWDNAPMERLFRSLKTEWIPRAGYGTFQEGSQDIGAYLMGYYNQERLHSYNNYVTPERQEQLWKLPTPVSKNT
jgi:putative transposase